MVKEQLFKAVRMIKLVSQTFHNIIHNYKQIKSIKHSLINYNFNRHSVV